MDKLDMNKDISGSFKGIILDDRFVKVVDFNADIIGKIKSDDDIQKHIADDGGVLLNNIHLDNWIFNEIEDKAVSVCDKYEIAARKGKPGFRLFRLGIIDDEYTRIVEVDRKTNIRNLEAAREEFAKENNVSKDKIMAGY